MKAITLWQPWASLIALGVKTIETRSWGAPRSLIGQRIAIHAAKRPAKFPDMKRLILETDPDVWNRWFAAGLVSERGELDFLPYGAVVGTSMLVDCVRMVARDDDNDDDRPILVVGDRALTLWERHRPGWPYEIGSNVTGQRPYGDFRPGRWAWLLGDSESFDNPIAATGRQGIWEWTP